MKKVVVYSGDKCTYCSAVKDYLNEKEISFEEKNIKDPIYKKELMALGFMSIPVILVDENIVLGFDKERLDMLLV